MDLQQLKENIQQWGRELGFQQIGIADTDLSAAEADLKAWLAKGYQGQMQWMSAHGDKRFRPEALEPGTLRVISARMDYLPPDTQPVKMLGEKDKAYVSRYALGRDYHKLIRKRLATLAARIRAEVGDSELARAFVDSAPVMEKPLAAKAGLGWQGRHEQAEMVVRYIKGLRDKTAAAQELQRTKSEGFTRATGGMNYIDLPRMAYYVDKATYRKAVTTWIGKLGGSPA